MQRMTVALTPQFKYSTVDVLRHAIPVLCALCSVLGRTPLSSVQRCVQL